MNYLYTFRHTSLTRWAAHMDPYTLGYLAGHSDFSTQVHTVRDAIERARNGHDGAKSAHSV